MSETSQTRITPVPRSQFGLYARVSDFIVRRMVGRSIDPLSVHAHVPVLIKAGGGMERVFMGKRRTPHRTLELVSVRTAMEIGCSFCLDFGSFLAHTKHGVTEEELTGLSSHADCGLFSVAEVAALDLAVAMTATPPTVDDDLFARLHEHYDDAQLVEITAMIGWENYRARTNAAFGMGSQGFSAPGACAVPSAAVRAAAADLAVNR